MFIRQMLLVFGLTVCVAAFCRAGEATSMKIEEIDRNFRSAKVGDLEVHYYNALKAPFVLTGFPWRDESLVFNRLPAAFTEKEVTKSALNMSRHATGGAIRFRTDSGCLVLRAKLAFSSDMNHMPRAASSGFDLYLGAGGKILYWRSVQPAHARVDVEVLLANSTEKKMKDWTLYLPLYGSASSIEIGIAPDARFEAPTPQAIGNPILFYGSSITQGACASRPGNAYTTMLCRAVDAPQINLGFSGSGKGEIAVANAIAGLELAAFVLDYDHNAPTPDYLRQTHEPFFKAVREKQPDLPIIMLSRCNFNGSKDNQERRDIIRQTYENAVKAGDKNVWFIDGETLYGSEERDACTVDNTHPNDLGFYRMYKTILPVLKEALGSTN